MQQPSTFVKARQIIQANGMGLRGLNKGLTATLGRHGVFNMVYFGFYFNVKNIIPANSVSVLLCSPTKRIMGWVGWTGSYSATVLLMPTNNDNATCPVTHTMTIAPPLQCFFSLLQVQLRKPFLSIMTASMLRVNIPWATRCWVQKLQGNSAGFIACFSSFPDIFDRLLFNTEYWTVWRKVTYSWPPTDYV